jgi:hypothetical protein
VAGVTCTSERISKKQVPHSKRHQRECGRIKDTLRVKDLSVGGLFVETVKACPVDATVELRFLVEDGESKADATVRCANAGSGLGL